MRVFQSLVGPDLDADALLPAALQMADKRVVVKRPDYAGWLNEHETQHGHRDQEQPLRRLCDGGAGSG